MSSVVPWPSLRYDDWRDTCDTLHAYTQVLGKLAVALAPPEPQLQHAALRLTARGWETAPLPAPDGSGALVVVLDLERHAVIAEHSDGRRTSASLIGDRPVGVTTRELLAHVRGLGGDFTFDPRPQEVSWSVPLDEDDQHTHYDLEQVSVYFQAATQAALALGAFRAPYRGRATPVNAWWGSFDVAVSLFSGKPAATPSDDFIMRNAMDAEEFAVGWWPGDENYGQAALYAYAHPAPADFESATLTPPAAHWNASLGEFIFNWEDVCAAPDPRAAVLAFARSAFRHSCAACGWDPALPASAEGSPPPVR